MLCPPLDNKQSAILFIIRQEPSFTYLNSNTCILSNLIRDGYDDIKAMIEQYGE